MCKILLILEWRSLDDQIIFLSWTIWKLCKFAKVGSKFCQMQNIFFLFFCILLSFEMHARKPSSLTLQLFNKLNICNWAFLGNYVRSFLPKFNKTIYNSNCIFKSRPSSDVKLHAHVATRICTIGMIIQALIEFFWDNSVQQCHI